MCAASNDVAIVSTAAEQPPRTGALSWFSNKEWALLLAALAVVIGGTTAAALTPSHSAAASAPNPAKTALASAVGDGATNAATATPASLTTAPPSVAADTSATTTGTVAETTSGNTAATTTGTSTTGTKKVKKKTVAKSTTKAAVSILSVGTYVYYGTYAGVPLRWRVLDADDGALLLLSQYVVSAGAFQSDWEGKNASLYSASEVHAWLKGTFTPEAFDTTETAALLPQVGGAASGDRVFLLNAAQAKQYLPTAADRKAAPCAAAGSGQVGFSGEGLSLTGPYASWWLADAASDEYTAQEITAAGKFGNQQVYYSDLGVRPAIRVERDKIAFTLGTQ